MANKNRSKSREAYATLYKSSKREESNRKRRLEKLLRENPNNAKQLELAIKNIRHRRKTPVNPTWTATKRKNAILCKEFKLPVAKYDEPNVVLNQKKMFSLGARAKDKNGNYVWA